MLGRRMKKVKPEVVKITKIGILVLFPLVLATMGAYLGLWIGIRFGKEEVTVPDVVGKEINQAESILKKKGLVAAIRTYRFSSEIPEEHVIKQSPRQGDKVKISRKIWLSVSTGEKQVVVPRLQGLTAKEADIVLRQSGLRPGQVVRAHVLESTRDVVVQQHPVPGTTDLHAPFVNFLVNKPRSSTTYLMPDLTGLKADDVSFFMRKQGFVLRPLEYESTYLEEAGVVITHYPRTGYPINRKTPVTLVVSQ